MSLHAFPYFDLRLQCLRVTPTTYKRSRQQEYSTAQGVSKKIGRKYAEMWVRRDFLTCDYGESTWETIMVRLSARPFEIIPIP